MSCMIRVEEIVEPGVSRMRSRSTAVGFGVWHRGLVVGLRYFRLRSLATMKRWRRWTTGYVAAEGSWRQRRLLLAVAALRSFVRTALLLSPSDVAGSSSDGAGSAASAGAWRRPASASSSTATRLRARMAAVGGSLSTMALRFGIDDGEARLSATSRFGILGSGRRRTSAGRSGGIAMKTAAVSPSSLLQAVCFFPSSSAPVLA
nr:hypothetical protein Iba_scaffold9193CG0010 [Ipomoea batatas]